VSSPREPCLEVCRCARAAALAGSPNACPYARVVLCAVTGATDYVRFPKRPHVAVALFEPESGQPRPDENPVELAARLLAEVRTRVEPATAGRRADR
jgi:hypothetical protein